MYEVLQGLLQSIRTDLELLIEVVADNPNAKWNTLDVITPEDYEHFAAIRNMLQARPSAQNAGLNVNTTQLTLGHSSITFQCPQVNTSIEQIKSAMDNLFQLFSYTNSMENPMISRPMHAVDTWALYSIARRFPFLEKNPNLSEKISRANYIRLGRYRHSTKATILPSVDTAGYQTQIRPISIHPSSLYSRFPQLVAWDRQVVNMNDQPDANKTHRDARNSASSATQMKSMNIKSADSEPKMDLATSYLYTADLTVVCGFCGDFIGEELTRDHEKWIDHIHRDMQPFICTVNDCPAGTFPSKEDWIKRILDAHYCFFGCPWCKQFKPDSKDAANQHVQIAHRDVIDHFEKHGKDLNHVISWSRVWDKRINVEDCTFCGGTLFAETPNDPSTCRNKKVSIDKYIKHLARHLIEIALLCLPSNDEEGADEALSTIFRFSVKPEAYSTPRRILKQDCIEESALYLVEWEDVLSEHNRMSRYTWEDGGDKRLRRLCRQWNDTHETESSDSMTAGEAAALETWVEYQLPLSGPSFNAARHWKATDNGWAEY